MPISIDEYDVSNVVVKPPTDSTVESIIAFIKYNQNGKEVQNQIQSPPVTTMFRVEPHHTTFNGQAKVECKLVITFDGMDTDQDLATMYRVETEFDTRMKQEGFKNAATWFPKVKKFDENTIENMGLYKNGVYSHSAVDKATGKKKTFPPSLSLDVKMDSAGHPLLDVYHVNQLDEGGNKIDDGKEYTYQDILPRKKFIVIYEKNAIWQVAGSKFGTSTKAVKVILLETPEVLANETSTVNMQSISKYKRKAAASEDSSKVAKTNAAVTD